MKTICRTQVMIHSIIITGLSCLQTYAQPANNSVTSSKIAATSVTPAVIYVNPTSGNDAPGSGKSQTSPLRTIAYALKQATPGTIVQLASGNYSAQSGEIFPLTVQQGVTLRGDESNKGQNIVINGGGRFISPTFARQNITVITEENSTITGVSITNPNKRGTAVWIESANPVVKNNTFAQSNREGVFVTGKAAPVIEANVFTKNGGNGISVADNAQGQIKNNLFLDTGFGLAIGGSATPVVSDNKIVQNKDGLFISDEARPVLQNNVIENNQRDGVVIAACAEAQLTLGGNVFNNNGQYDIHNSGVNSVTPTGNQVNLGRVMEQHQYHCGT